MFSPNSKIQKGRYTVLNELGKGSYGQVFKIYDQERNTHLAMKVLIADSKTSKVVTNWTESLFKNEFNAGLKIRSPFVIRTYDYFTQQKNLCFTMEFASNGSFLPKVTEVASDWKKLNRFAFHFYCGLGDIHRAGIVHRDIKSENILLDEDHHPKITDFGIAYFLNQESPDKIFGTHSKETFGTDPYIAPEQRLEVMADRLTGPITDIFSAGVMFYYIISKGQHLPFGKYSQLNANQAPEYVKRSMSGAWTDIRLHRQETPDYWYNILQRSLEPDPGKRIQSADEIRDLLQSQLEKSVRPSALIYSWEEIGLRVVVGKNAGKVYSLLPHMKKQVNGLINIGRLDPNLPDRNQINLEDDHQMVSRAQATIEYNRVSNKWFIRNGQFVMQQNESFWKETPSGLMVNKKEIGKDGIELRVGDELIFNRLILMQVIHTKS